MTDTTNNTGNNNAPVNVICDSNIKASIWKNERENGQYYSTTISKTYQDNDGNYHNTNSFSPNDLLKVSALARVAHGRICRMQQEQTAAPQQQKPAQPAAKQQSPQPSQSKEEFMQKRQSPPQNPTIKKNLTR